LGIELSFFVLAITLAAILGRLGLPLNLLQWLAAGMLLAFGLVLVVPKLESAFSKRVSRLLGAVPEITPRGDGMWAGLATGLPLGIVWTPCAGPILAGITLAATARGFSGQTLITLGAYAGGMFGPLLAVTLAGRRASGWLRRVTGGGRRTLQVMGVVLIATSLLVGLGGLNRLNRFLAENIGLTSTPTAKLEAGALNRSDRKSQEGGAPSRVRLLAGGYPETDGLEDLGPAPELTGISNWFNTDEKPLSIKGLRGKVVLIDFWTYSCINCIRTLPHLKALDEKYRDNGFVMLGVHTPEFAFEADPGNVGRAVKDFGIRYPVALDPEHKTWDRYYNRYWPAHYLIDKRGHIRFVHYGEGAYAETEALVRQLVGTDEEVEPEQDDADNLAQTPETYLGYRRDDRNISEAEGRVGPLPDRQAVYTVGERPEQDEWGFSGEWKVGPEYATAGGDAEIVINFSAAKVHIVAGPGPSGPGVISASGMDGVATLAVRDHRLYSVRSGKATRGTLVLKVSKGVKVYAFTFG
ncbi:MAG: cytochrome c biogenesis protein DipZ, partial [Actinomycetota bacterium]